MKTLILNGSPRVNGDTAALLCAFKSELRGEITELSAHRDTISPCLDCRHCITHSGCSISDDMDTIYRDDYDNLVIASPVYYGSLTGPMVSLASRLQVYHAAQPDRDSPRMLRPKRGAVFLTGGGKGNSEGALRYSRTIFHILNVTHDADDLALAFHTDTIPAKDDQEALAKVREIATRLNGAFPAS